MVGKDGFRRSYSLEQVLSEDHVRRILKRTVGKHSNSELICSKVNSASEEGLIGFLGDHIRAVLHIKVDERVEKVHLFVKRIPAGNKPKAAFIDENNFFRREQMVLSLMEDMKVDEGPNPWGVRAYVHTDSLVVMPDLAAAGYRVHALLEVFDLPHVTATAATVARFHASFANLETKKIEQKNRPYNFSKEYEHLLIETTFTDTPFVRTAAKLSADFLNDFSSKYSKQAMPGLEGKLRRLYIDACDSVCEKQDTWNVLLHKDLWNNNILFKYQDDVPINAVLVDYQCVRYAPPAFDLALFLYLTTSRTFREKHYYQILKHYYQVFLENLEESSKKRLEALGYDENDFLVWSERGRMFGMVLALCIFPCVLMDPQGAQKVWDDPDTYDTIINRDRSAPIVNYAKSKPAFRTRMLEIHEEFVERYVLNDIKG